MNEKEKSLTQTRLKEILNYNSGTGMFTWKITTTNGKGGKGVVAGWVDPLSGYALVSIAKVRYLQHRLAWLYTYGKFPDVCIDHIDGNGLNNKIDNLREATHAQNMLNFNRKSNNTSGYKGVHWHKATGKWAAACQVEGKRKHLGLFNYPEEAYKVYCAYAQEHHGEFFNTGLERTILKQKGSI